MITLDKISLRYGSGPEILQNVSLRLEDGSFHFLVGPSGAGKSSLLRCLYLAQRPTSGSITFLGQDVFSLSRGKRAQMRRKIGIIFQDFRLLPHLNAIENVCLPLAVAGEKAKEALPKAKEILDWVGLEKHHYDYPETLSGGQQQRIAIARAVITRPRLILADEPTGNLDDAIAYRLLHLFRELHKMGTTVLIATHNEALANRHAYPRLVLAQGRVEPAPQAQPSYNQEETPL